MVDPDGVEERSAPREIRVEGFGLFLLGGLLLVVVVAAFLLGRWAGLRAAANAPIGSPGATASSALEEPTHESRPDHFDTVQGGEKSPEPDREAATRPEPVPAPAPAEPQAPAGPWVVQVFAGRDRAAAESLRASLESRGYPARLDRQEEGGDILFKVRVGGYPSEGEARTAAERLKKDGETGAWVTRNR